MKKLLIFVMLSLLASCTLSKRPHTPIPAIDPIVFEKEGGEISVPMSASFMFVFDKDQGYKYTQHYDFYGVFEFETLECDWVVFKGFRYDISEDLFILAEPNNTGQERTITMMLENVWNTQHSGKSSLTVIQKGE